MKRAIQHGSSPNKGKHFSSSGKKLMKVAPVMAGSFFGSSNNFSQDPEEIRLQDMMLDKAIMPELQSPEPKKMNFKEGEDAIIKFVAQVAKGHCTTAVGATVARAATIEEMCSQIHNQLVERSESFLIPRNAGSAFVDLMRRHTGYYAGVPANFVDKDSVDGFLRKFLSLHAKGLSEMVEDLTRGNQGFGNARCDENTNMNFQAMEATRWIEYFKNQHSDPIKDPLTLAEDMTKAWSAIRTEGDSAKDWKAFTNSCRFLDAATANGSIVMGMSTAVGKGRLEFLNMNDTVAKAFKEQGMPEHMNKWIAQCFAKRYLDYMETQSSWLKHAQYGPQWGDFEQQLKLACRDMDKNPWFLGAAGLAWHNSEVADGRPLMPNINSVRYASGEDMAKYLHSYHHTESEDWNPKLWIPGDRAQQIFAPASGQRRSRNGVIVKQTVSDKNAGMAASVLASMKLFKHDLNKMAPNGPSSAKTKIRAVADQEKLEVENLTKDSVVKVLHKLYDSRDEKVLVDTTSHETDHPTIRDPMEYEKADIQTKNEFCRKVITTFVGDQEKKIVPALSSILGEAPVK